MLLQTMPRIHTASAEIYIFTTKRKVVRPYTSIIDTIYIDRNPVLHVVDESTRYQSTRWFDSASAEAGWRALKVFWIYMYLDFSDVVRHGVGK